MRVQLNLKHVYIKYNAFVDALANFNLLLNLSKYLLPINLLQICSSVFNYTLLYSSLLKTLYKGIFGIRNRSITWCLLAEEYWGAQNREFNRERKKRKDNRQSSLIPTNFNSVNSSFPPKPCSSVPSFFPSLHLWLIINISFLPFLCLFFKQNP